MNQSKHFMRNLSSKFGISILTFFVGTILALIWFTLYNKPIEIVEVPPHFPKIEVLVPDEKVPEPPLPEDEKPIKSNVSKRNKMKFFRPM